MFGIYCTRGTFDLSAVNYVSVYLAVRIVKERFG